MNSREMREALAYILGGLGFLHELFIQQAERPFLLTASLALMGFPLVFRTDEYFKNRKKILQDIEEEEPPQLPPRRPQR